MLRLILQPLLSVQFQILSDTDRANDLLGDLMCSTAAVNRAGPGSGRSRASCAVHKNSHFQLEFVMLSQHFLEACMTHNMLSTVERGIPVAKVLQAQIVSSSLVTNRCTY